MEKTLECEGGPLAGYSLNLQQPYSGTLTFTLNGQTGFYKKITKHMGYPNGKREILKWVKHTLHDTMKCASVTQ